MLPRRVHFPIRPLYPATLTLREAWPITFAGIVAPLPSEPGAAGSRFPSGGERNGRPIATARDDEDHSARSRVSVALSLRCRRYARQRWLPNASSVGPGKWLEAPKAELPAEHEA